MGNVWQNAQVCVFIFEFLRHCGLITFLCLFCFGVYTYWSRAFGVGRDFGVSGSRTGWLGSRTVQR